MKVGDLVIMPGSCYRDREDGQEAVGIVVSVKDPHVGRLGLARVCIRWNDSDRNDWEPLEWLEVISETQSR